MPRLLVSSFTLLCLGLGNEISPEHLAADDECLGFPEGQERDTCAFNALQLRGVQASKPLSKPIPAASKPTGMRLRMSYNLTTETDAGGQDIKSRGPPATPFAYKGMAWPTMKIAGPGPTHFFAIGDWGGLDGTLPPEPGRHNMVMYSGGATPGPKVMPRNRWDKEHLKCVCKQAELLRCFNSHGSDCPAGCGFVPGVDDQPQQLVAAAFNKRAALMDPTYVINVGDNFYWGGIEHDCGSTPMGSISPTAKHQFDNIFEAMYNGPGVDGKPWISIFGNHDWGGRMFSNGWDQQIAYTWASPRWVLPAPYYSWRAEYPDQGFSVDFWMLDSNMNDAKEPHDDIDHNICGTNNKPGADCSKADGPASIDTCKDWFWQLWGEQQQWLEKSISQSTADWQIIVTHFPCGFQEDWYRKLHNQYGLDLLITGHRHDQELWEASRLGGLTCFVTGGGGGITSEASPDPMNKQYWYGEGQYGFYDLTITKDTINIDSINYDGKVVKSAVVHPK